GLLDVTFSNGNFDGLTAGSGVVSGNHHGTWREAAVARIAWAPERPDRIALEPVKSDDRRPAGRLEGAIADARVAGVRATQPGATAKQRSGRAENDAPSLGAHALPFSMKREPAARFLVHHRSLS